MKWFFRSEGDTKSVMSISTSSHAFRYSLVIVIADVLALSRPDEL